MSVTATTSEEISVGAGDVWYQDENDLWQPVGATLENNVFRVNTEYAEIDLNGVVGPITGLDYVTNQLAELEVSVAQIGADKLALMVPGARSTIETHANVVGGHSSLLAAATAVGQYLAIKIDSVTALSIGDSIRVGDSGAIEFRHVTRVGTMGAGGTGIDVDFPLQLTHSVGDQVDEVTGTGMTVIKPPTERRVPTSAYHNWRLDVPGLDGRMVRFHILNGLMTDNAEFEAADDDAMGPRLVLQSRIDPANASDGSWRIERVPAYATLVGS